MNREERKLYQRVYRTRTKYTRADIESEYGKEYRARKRKDNDTIYSNVENQACQIQSQKQD